jgi:hypothetical protein
MGPEKKTGSVKKISYSRGTAENGVKAVLFLVGGQK